MTTYTPPFCAARLPEERPWDATACSASSPLVVLRVLRCGKFPLADVPDGPHRADVGDLIHVAPGDAAALVDNGMAEEYG